MAVTVAGWWWWFGAKRSTTVSHQHQPLHAHAPRRPAHSSLPLFPSSPYLSHSDQEVRANIVKSLLLNSLSLASIYGFDLLLAPLLHGQTRWVHRNVGWFYQALWLLPVVGVSFYLNVSTRLRYS